MTGVARTRQSIKVRRAAAVRRTATNPATFTVPPGPVLAPAYILMDVDTGRVLAQRNARKRMFPASTTKTMTALVAITQANLDKVVTVGPNPPQTGEQGIDLLQGEQFTLRDLVRAALIKSANDACVAIAEGVAGSVPSFARMMNNKARELGARDTHFVNPHGLHDPRHYTTAYDLALMARAAMREPFFNETVGTRALPIHGNFKLGPQRLLLNRNRLLFRWGECDGVKTGYTKQAGRCLIASATRVDPATKRRWRLLSVVLHSPNTWDESANLLMHSGFNRYRSIEVARAGEIVATLNVAGGAFDARGVAESNKLMPLRADEQSNLSTRVREFKLKAPVRKGQTVGYIEYSTAGAKIGEVRLVAQDNVPQSMVTQLVPATGAFLPSNPALNLGLLGAGVLSIALLLAGLKINTNEKRRRSDRLPTGSIYSPHAPYAARREPVVPTARRAGPMPQSPALPDAPGDGEGRLAERRPERRERPRHAERFLEEFYRDENPAQSRRTGA